MNKLGVTFDNDNFSGRLLRDTESISIRTQFNIYCEELARRNFGLLNEWTYSVEPVNELNLGKLTEVLDDIVVALSGSGKATSYRQGLVESMLIMGDAWAAKLTLGHLWDLDDEGIRGIQDNAAVSNINVHLVSADPEIHKTLLASLGQAGFALFGQRAENSSVPVFIATPDDMTGISISAVQFEKVPFENIRANYTPDVVQSFNTLLNETLLDMSHGIIVVNGPPGTGKSFLIRSLISELDRRAVVCSPPSLFLREAKYLNKVTDRFRKAVVVLEDVGDFLTEDNFSMHIDSTSTLLNYSDGLLSLLANCLFVLTFNANIGKISQAITRPGRCLAQIEVGLLPFEQASKLVGFPIPKKEYTLAEVYEMRRIGGPIPSNSSRDIGFRINSTGPV